MQFKDIFKSINDGLINFYWFIETTMSLIQVIYLFGISIIPSVVDIFHIRYKIFSIQYIGYTFYQINQSYILY